MCDEPVVDEANILLQAFNKLRSAIALLDEAGAPGHIAAHVDLAAHQLSEFLGTDNLDRQASTKSGQVKARQIN